MFSTPLDATCRISIQRPSALAHHQYARSVIANIWASRLTPNLSLIHISLEEDQRLQIAFCKRIMSDLGPTGLIRIFSHDTETINLLLTEGAFVAGRHYRTEESRQTERHIPCPRCHLYGHTAASCSYQPRCRACGNKTPTTICPHTNHDFSSPFCATCNSSSDHFTGQTLSLIHI